MKYKVITMNNFYKDLDFPKNREVFGIYHSSDWSPIPGYNNKVFMVVFNLDYRLFSPVDYLDFQEYAKGCVLSLNNTTKSKRDKTPIFGQLTYYKSKILTHKTGNKYIQVFALTNEKKNKKFFRMGDAIEVVPSADRRDTPTVSVEEYVQKAAEKAAEPPKKRGRPKKTEEQKQKDAKTKERVSQMKKQGRPAKNKKEV